MKQHLRMGISPTRLALLIALQLLAQSVQARDYFNPALLETGNPSQSGADLAVFEENGNQLPGDYRVDVLINDQQVDTRMVTFTAGADGQGLQPCISVAELADYGVRVAQFPALGAPDAACANFSAIPQASTRLLFDRQQLALSIPQAALARQPRGYVPSTQWDEGITALLLNYSLSGANNTAR
ncbi:fimbrial assembly protein, partial [Serratia proteamaculans]|uniref:FimD/PapC N-terminal domain-containing protein n=1 Tax=Serratia proteamaculans TaxID=28151 RepID=UPI001C2D84E3